MHTLTKWTARRSGPCLTVTGTDADGQEVKVSGIDAITVEGGQVVAAEGAFRAERRGASEPLRLRLADGRDHLINRIDDILNVGTGDRVKDAALAGAKISDIRMLLDSFK